MSKVKRLRIFAGPNGSGKSTLFEAFSRNYYPGIFINSDLIEKEILEKGFLDLENFGLNLSQSDFDRFLQTPNAQTLVEKSRKSGHSIDIEIKENIIVDKSHDTHSYEAGLITSFLREYLVRNGISFSFETVMSHASKLDEITAAKNLGYRIYLYFICLDEPALNISRVKNRVEKGGHDVSPEKIISRYENTLTNLYPALKIADRAYLFDNSDDMLLVAEKNFNELILEVEEEKFPNWFTKFVIDKA